MARSITRSGCPDPPRLRALFPPRGGDGLGKIDGGRFTAHDVDAGGAAHDDGGCLHHADAASLGRVADAFLARLAPPAKVKAKVKAKKPAAKKAVAKKAVAKKKK